MLAAGCLTSPDEHPSTRPVSYEARWWMKYEHQSSSAPVCWINPLLKFTAVFASSGWRESGSDAPWRPPDESWEWGENRSAPRSDTVGISAAWQWRSPSSAGNEPACVSSLWPQIYINKTAPTDTSRLPRRTLCIQAYWQEITGENRWKLMTFIRVPFHSV